MKKSRGVWSLIATTLLIVLLGFTTIVGFGKGKIGSAKNITLGLDLAGGVSITYQAKDKNPTSEQMSDTIYKLQKRVEQYSTEATVYQEGDDRINIEIPGVTDANKILDELGKPGSLVFQDSEGNVVLEGTDVKTASAKTTQDEMNNKEYIVELILTKDGTDKFAKATAENLGKQIAIVYDGKTIRNPVVQSEIDGGQAYIDGMASYEEAENLASTIRIGGLQLELEELRSNVVGAQLGEEAISTSLLAGAIGLAIVTVIGRCIGAGEKEQAKYYSKRLLGLAYAGMVLADLALFVLVKPIIACFALSAEAARIATQLLVSFAICAALIWPLSFTLPNVLRAAGDAKYTMEVSVFSMWVFRVASSYFCAGTMGLGVLGVWIGMYVDWGFRTLLFVIRYRRGKWLEKRVV